EGEAWRHGASCPWRHALHPEAPRATLLPADLEVVEVALGVGLGPQANLARLLEGHVLDVQVPGVVEVAQDVVVLHGDVEPVPLAGLDRQPSFVPSWMRVPATTL